MTDKPIRVRIAPSPSGYLHVGTARMAIANWLFARHNSGKFLIRIEDTDLERSNQELIEPILSALEWLGISSDEEIVYQSKRMDIYGQFAQIILDSGQGYRCFCSSELLKDDRDKAMAEKEQLSYNRRCIKLTDDEIKTKLDNNEPYTIRIRIPEGSTTFHDLVSGDLERQNVEIEDFIIARSDGTATYNLAVVIDDHQMGISHVIRGNDHITNTFKQINIYRALGFEIPEFAHVPLILRPDKRKVSKRLGDKDVAEYKQDGILPEAMFNFLCLLGWSSKDDREYYTVKELIDVFNIDYFNKSNAIFNEEKLLSFNQHHIMNKPDHELAVLVAPMLVDAGYTTKYWLETRWEYLRSIIGALKTRVKVLNDFVTQSKYFFDFDYKYDQEAAEINFNTESAGLLSELADRFDNLEDFSHDKVEEALSCLAAEKDIKKGKLIHPTRLAVSGISKGPGLYDLLVILSKPVVVERMKKAVRYINENNS